MAHLPLIIEPETLAAELDNDTLLMLDLRDPDAYASNHIPGAVNFNLSHIVNTAPPRGGLLPNEKQVSDALSQVGYQNQHIVAIDDHGGPQSARLLWTLRAFGINTYSFLNGGMVAWNQDIGVLDATSITPKPSQYQAKFNGANVADRDYILAHLNTPDVQIIDTRSNAEYLGIDQRSARGGHIPGAQHFEWSQVKEPDTMKLKPLTAIQQQLAVAGIQPERETIAYCQTHMRSSVITLVLEALGYRKIKGYPGAWSDWGNCDNTPIE